MSISLIKNNIVSELSSEINSKGQVELIEFYANDELILDGKPEDINDFISGFITALEFVEAEFQIEENYEQI